MKIIPDGEPDVKRFSAYGLQCVIRRHPSMKHLCGYVKVPNGSVFWKLLKKKSRLRKHSLLRIRISQYNAKEIRRLQCHGGVTFGGRSGFYLMQRGLWLGFDCAQYDDIAPGLIDELEKIGLGVSHHFEFGTYKDLAFVEEQCRFLAKQITEVSYVPN